MPELRAHPALAGVSLPERLGAPGPAGAFVTRGGLVFIGSGDTALYAFDKDTGRELMRLPTREAVQATPMTYLDRTGRQIIVVATGRADQTSLLAFGLQ
jgi:quinoprotein glucose dehydrogenase